MFHLRFEERFALEKPERAALSFLARRGARHILLHHRLPNRWLLEESQEVAGLATTLRKPE